MIHIDGSQVLAFGIQLRDAPPELRGEFRRAIKTAAGDLVRDIQGNASWSSRIPSAVRTRVGFGARSTGVQVRVDAAQAPHARPLEFGNKPGFNRHPVHGGPAWSDQPVRPFFMRAVRANEQQVVTTVQGAINEVFRRL